MVRDLDVNTEDLDANHPLRSLTGVKNQMSLIDDGDGNKLIVVDHRRILVPVGERDRVLRLLHIPHQGYSKTVKEGRELFMWPNMSTQVKTMCDNCSVCLKFSASREGEKFITEQQPITEMRRMENISVDNFAVGGKDYLCMTDRCSGFIMVSELANLSSSCIIKSMMKTFFLVAFPKVIRSDGATCFTSQEFIDFARKWNVKLELSSPYNPAGNGLGESGVKQSKHLMLKCRETGADFAEALYSLNTMQKTNSPAPGELFWQETVGNQLPRIPAEIDPLGKQKRQSAQEQMREKSQGRAHKDGEFQPGQRVVVQDHKTHRWVDIVGDKHTGDEGRSYDIVFEESGNKSRRNGKFLKPAPQTADPTPGHTSQPAPLPTQPVSQLVAARTRARTSAKTVQIQDVLQEMLDSILGELLLLDCGRSQDPVLAASQQ